MAAALLTWTPTANADDPLPCDQQPADQQQQCQQQQQNPGAKIANGVIDNVQQGMDQAQQVQNAIDPNTGQPYPGRPMHLLLDGVETCWPIGVPTPVGAKQEPVPGDATGRC